MKKVYASPEAKLICLEPVESLANGFVLFDELLSGVTTGLDTPISGKSDDLGVEI